MNTTELNSKIKEQIKLISVIKDNPEYAHALSPLALKVADISLDNLIQKLAKKLDKKPIKISKNSESEETDKEIENRIDMLLIELAKLGRSRPFKKATVILNNKYEALIALTILSDVSLFLHH
jgi:ACT domain-containing protein